MAQHPALSPQPVPKEETVARDLDLPLLLVAPNCLGTLSHVLTAYESAERRGLDLHAVVLTEVEPPENDSKEMKEHLKNS